MGIDSRRSFWGYLILSLLLHLAVAFLPRFLPVPHQNFERIELTVIDAPPPDVQVPAKPEEKLRIADQDKVNEEIDDKAKFLSSHNQKVLRQTVARKRGEFKNVRQNQPAGDGAPEKAAEKNLFKAFLPKLDVVKTIDARDEMERRFEEDPEFRKQAQANRAKEQEAMKREEKPSLSPGGEASQTLDYIKELDPGLETLLSTKEFKYYTYFSRIRKQLNHHWTPRVRQKVAQIYKQGRSIASSTNVVTRCLVTLDRTGRLIRVQIIGLSGVVELDEAAVEAFRAAAPFPNPPSGMVDPDGTIKIRWDFILEA